MRQFFILLKWVNAFLLFIPNWIIPHSSTQMAKKIRPIQSIRGVDLVNLQNNKKRGSFSLAKLPRAVCHDQQCVWYGATQPFLLFLKFMNGHKLCEFFANNQKESLKIYFVTIKKNFFTGKEMGIVHFSHTQFFSSWCFSYVSNCFYYTVGIRNIIHSHV